VTDQQPNKLTLTQPNHRLNKNPSQVPLIIFGSMLLMTVSTAVITVLHFVEALHVPHESCLRKLNTHCTDGHPYTLLWGVLGNHNMAIQWFPLACNVPTEVSPLV
jgi:hypothetical protein